MCIFTGAVEAVGRTKIFARSVNGHQILVYEMAYIAAADLAMVLPIPVPPDAADDAIRFIALDRYPDFFEDLRKGFEDAHGRSVTFSSSVAAPLQIHDVGDFEASFVPRLRDFTRLDSRFRLPESLWNTLPQYLDYGFAVFKLKSARARRKVHPMAFEFPRRDPTQLFFPTVHVHDGTVREADAFDHILYLQTDDSISSAVDTWDKTFVRVEDFMDVERAKGILLPRQGVRRLRLAGRRENRDTFVGRDGSVPEAMAS